ncbi:AraC family transcriptional regulator [Vibrio chagasii]|uniref:AraC family transcriptional regulator n=1 Tax=Vibrio chagasii TaxID=170679 RepID=UPI0038CD8DCA
MNDPLSDIFALLKPVVIQAKLSEASGSFRVRREDVKDIYYCMVLEGTICFDVDGLEPQVLQAGDFALLPSSNFYTVSSYPPPKDSSLLTYPRLDDDGIYRLGTGDTPLRAKQLLGYCSFSNPDELLLSILPKMLVVRGESRLMTLGSMIRDELFSKRPAYHAMTKHLLRALLIEAFRSTPKLGVETGLLNGLSDHHIGLALNAIHNNPELDWTVAKLASEVGMSRSSLFSKFGRLVGIAPMEYLFNWRMLLATDRLKGTTMSVEEIALQIGYSSSSAFSTAFTRCYNTSPSAYRSENQ